ncbi:MAG: hypothetical protein COU35_02120 [Candidatus Magasanikbacteria bacterium CG10_big_fil_rev_8_21_14_0_10_47_10]|uniref:Uncharacterized protein n=1 Tax=Candidatus Magasanikbacteria bacterium CG10_big_fil_rev_8_21_14_0_10_47_10 TaxID=1974652 RepID=A0A2H0TQW2_9BACT|nr:MAG: hypothetical protein COU35_02120 [Candidatus Magasanikbacteria bacterium CG10_big_fil_rev_8_21_14_0_10_47_10]
MLRVSRESKKGGRVDETPEGTREVTLTERQLALLLAFGQQWAMTGTPGFCGLPRHLGDREHEEARALVERLGLAEDLRKILGS